MEVTKENLTDGRLSLLVNVPAAEWAKYLPSAAAKVSANLKVEGFRPGKVPLEVLRQRVGEMIIVEEAAKELIYKEADVIIDREVSQRIVGQPRLSLTKLAWEADLEFKIEVDLWPSVKLASYKERQIKVDEVKVNDQDINKVLDNLCQSRAQESASDQPAVIGDKVIVDLRMFLDKVPVDGGQAQSVPVILGQEYIIPGLSDKLAGVKINDSREFTLPYPADHYQKNLAGKKVEFSAVVKNVLQRQVPELNDDLAKSYGAASAEELRQQVQVSLEHEQLHRAQDKAELALLDGLIGESDFGPLPDTLIVGEQEAMSRETQQRLEAQGGKFNDYLMSVRQTVDQFKAGLKTEAVKRVKLSLLLRQIIEEEKLTIEPEKVAKELERLKQQYGNNAEASKTLANHHYQDDLANQLLIQETLGKLKEWNFIDYQPHQH